MVATVTRKKVRVLIGKPGLDGHDRGAKVIARALRDAGVEVVYTGLHRSPEEIVETAIQEDVDAIGVSILSGAHLTLLPRVVELLKEAKAEDILVFGGGVIPEEDRQILLGKGVKEIIVPGGGTQRTIDFLKENFPDRFENK
ncbi:MAG: cobalamin B12-binding domain-containing protein [Cyanobacteria bacterium TGS_CYA1]|nr:cobalamin B12-binding domain-containing protein [Cyanobacteria bacterium TGS_CYA1]